MPHHAAAHLSPAATDRCVVAFLAVTLGVAVATQSGPPLPPRDVARFWAAAATYGAFFAVTFLPGYTAPRSRLRVWCAFALRAVVLPLVLMALVQAPITLRTLTVGPRDGAAAWAAFAATRCPMAALAMLSSASARLPSPWHRALLAVQMAHAAVMLPTACPRTTAVTFPGSGPFLHALARRAAAASSAVGGALIGVEPSGAAAVCAERACPLVMVWVNAAVVTAAWYVADEGVWRPAPMVLAVGAAAAWAGTLLLDRRMPCHSGRLA